jgi:hypothetical protein
LTREIISGGHLVLVEQPPDAQHGVQAERDLGLHVGELLLDELRRGQRLAEHLAVQRVIARGVPAELRRAHGAPGDAIAGAVEALNGPARDFTPGRRLASGTKTSSIMIMPVVLARRLNLPSIFGKVRPFIPRFQQEAAQDALIVLRQTTATSAWASW